MGYKIDFIIKLTIFSLNYKVWLKKNYLKPDEFFFWKEILKHLAFKWIIWNIDFPTIEAILQ